MRHAATERSVALMRFLSGVTRRLGVAKDVYVVGGAVRNFLIDRPIKDIDVVIDSVRAGKDSAWLAKQVAKAIPVPTSLVTNQYGVAILTVKGPWELDGHDLDGEVIEIANARKESYGGESGKGYKPHMVEPTTIEEDVIRREFTFNTLMWRLLDLASGPDKAEIIDLTGCGLRDLERRETRCPRDPDVVFADDPTRLLRAVKFVAKYGFKIPPDLAAAIRKNAPRMKQAPHEAIATILVHDVLDQPTARSAVKLMKQLGLLDVVSEMVQEEPGFSSYLSRQLAKDRKVDLLLDLLDLGLRVKSPVSFLTRPQQARLREITTPMPEGKAEEFLETLRNPPLDNVAIIERFNIPPKERGAIKEIAQAAMLADPSLARNPRALQRAVEDEMGRKYRTAADKGKIPGGFAEKEKKKPSDFDPDELKMGIEVEMEHLVGGGHSDEEARAMAEEIAMDHLTEIRDYYTRLKAMEAEAEGKKATAELSKGDRRKVFDLLIKAKGKEIPDSEVHELAEEIGVSAHDLESFIYSLASQWAMQERKVALRRAWWTLKTGAVGGDVTGNRSSVGLFIPLPNWLAEQYPKLAQDDSPSHVTLLYGGDVPAGREGEFLEIVRDVLGKEPGPIKAWTDGVDKFLHTDKDQTIFYTPIRFSRDIGEIKDRLWVALEANGFEVRDRSPLAYFPHTTLEYRPGLHHEHGYDKPAPEGAWEFDSVQVWGLPDLVEIPLGTYIASDFRPPDVEDKNGELPNAWLRQRWGSFLK
jgi:tRNA nucleotidyltransferase/poly(A) polymerase/2'-5' RNA ligase